MLVWLLFVEPAAAQLRGRSTTVPVPAKEYSFASVGEQHDSVASVFAMRAHAFAPAPPWLDGVSDPRSLGDLRTALENSSDSHDRDRLQLRVCEALERDFVAARTRLHADASIATPRETVGRFLEQQRELGRCLRGVATSEHEDVRTLALRRLAYYHASLTSFERREDDRARAILERLDATSDEMPSDAPPCPTATGIESDFMCGWAAMRAGDFEIAAGRLGAVLANPQADDALRARARVGWGLALAMTASEDKIRHAIQTAPIGERIVMFETIARGLRLAGRHDVSAGIVEQLAAERPVGLVRCRLSLQVARERSEVVEIERATRALEAAAADLRALRAGGSSDRDRCELELAELVRELASRWHTEARTTLSRAQADGARRAYRIYLDLFPSAPDIYDVRYYAAELAWNQAESAGGWNEAAAMYEQVTGMGRVGRFTREAAYAVILAIKKARDAREPVPDLLRRILAAVQIYERGQPPEEVANVWADVGLLLAEEGLGADAARLLGRGIEANPSELGDRTPRLVALWTALGDWTALDGFMTTTVPKVLAKHPELRVMLDEAAPIIRAKVCEAREADRTQGAACYRALADDPHAGVLGAWARAKADALDAP